MKTCVVLVFLIAACASSSSALRCYSCTYPADSKCGDAKDLQGETCSELNAGHKQLNVKAFCWKNAVDVDEMKQVTRSCTEIGGSLNPCTFTGKASEHCSVCETDLCNGSSKLLINFWTMMMPIAITFFMKSY